MLHHHQVAEDAVEDSPFVAPEEKGRPLLLLPQNLADVDHCPNFHFVVERHHLMPVSIPRLDERHLLVARHSSLKLAPGVVTSSAMMRMQEQQREVVPFVIDSDRHQSFLPQSKKPNLLPQSLQKL